MFFKNLTLFRLPVGFSINADALSEHLAQHAFQECALSNMKSEGWVAPSKHGLLAHQIGNQCLIALKVEEKILPASVVKRFTAERVRLIEEEQGRKVGRKERKELAEQVSTDLLPRAFTSERVIHGWIDIENRWLGIDTPTRAKAEQLLEAFLKSVTPVPAIKQLKLNVSPCGAMNGWISSGDAPAGFTLDQDLELKSAEQSKVRYVKHALEGDEIKQHIADGKVATKLAMTWTDRISFVLTDEFQLRRIQFLDILKEESAGQAETEEERFDLDFTLMSGELSRLLADLVLAHDGEESKN